jgi:hypothetical protein
VRAIALCLAALLLGCGQQAEPVLGSKAPIHVVRCKQPMPEFTLGPQTVLSTTDEEALCACIWNELGEWERRTSELIAQGKEAEVSYMHMRAFPSRFGSAMEKCGGMDL